MAKVRKVSVKVTAEQAELLTNLVQTHLADAKRALADCEARPYVTLKEWRDALVAAQDLQDILLATGAALEGARGREARGRKER
jgi:hypothetical protein